MHKKRFFFITFCLVFSLFISLSLAKTNLYHVEFSDADIQDAIRLLAKIGNKNIVVSDKITGKVTASFDKISITDALNAVLNTNGYGVVERNKILQVHNKEEITEFGEDLKTTSYNLNYATAKDTLPHIESLISERGSVFADDRTNAIHVRDTATVSKNIATLISRLDRKGKQVLIEAKIIEANSNFVRSLGIQWGITRTGSAIQTAGLTSVGTADSGRSLMFNGPASGLNTSAPLAGVGLILGSFKGSLTDIQLSMAEQHGDINILARPSIATMDNQAATIRSGTTFYIKTSGDVNIGSSDTGTSSSSSGSNLQEIATGIELVVTPQISLNNYIKLAIEATESEADFTKAIDGVPAVIDNVAQTTVMLKNQETTIIGGLFRVRDARTVKGVPGLMKIPILGNLFKSKTKSTEKSELLIFITPKVIDSAVTTLPHFIEQESAYNPVPNVSAQKKNKKKNKK
ncbi:MAG: secretin N-terminal domain-containing protein [bacterium]|nr:hypothetical protein [bacterium]MBU1916829.1 hypothetical protein [bacterium]